MLVVSVGLVAILVGVLMLIPIGLRNGDGPCDALLACVKPQSSPRGALVTVTNRGGGALIVGLSLRPRGLRLRVEGGTYVRVRARTLAPDLMPERQDALGVVPVGETSTFFVPANRSVRQRAELVAVMGQPGRLRTVHASVRLPPPGARRRAARRAQAGTLRA
jgi:hypothetical protein